MTKYRKHSLGIRFNANFPLCAILFEYITILLMRWAGRVARMGEERWCIGSWWGNRKESDHWGDLSVDGWIILGWISRRWDVGIWTGLSWPRIETGGGRM